MKQSTLLSTYCACVLFFFTTSAYAVTTTYSSQANFFTALGSATVNTENFDALTPGTTLASGSTLGGATLSYSLGGALISVENEFDTTSLNNYIGTNDGSGAFLGGDSFTITFDQVIHAIGLYVISADVIFADDFTISTNGGQSVTNSDVPDITLTDGDAFYLGLIEDDFNLGFTSITLSSFDDNYLFNVDDITAAQISPVPLPAAAWLFASGLLGLAGIRRRKKINL